MSKEEQTDEKITERAKDYSQWYLDVISAAELAENSPVKGCMIIKPYGYAIWENIQKILDNKFKEKGVENAYFPLFIPKSFLEKEAKHVEGFAKECAVVTHHRLKLDDNKLVPDGLLEEPLIIRPTSETIMYDAFSRWIESYRDLPLMINQWANIVRWEMRTRPFLRTTEFLWQEGHTAHATKNEAEEKAMEMIKIYQDFAQDILAVPVIAGKKSEAEKFAGADYTLTIEAMMQDGKALQAGTSHLLGQNFAKAFEVKFLNEKGEKEYVWQTSWGVSTRIIGAIIMVHSDDKGLVLPPNIAPLNVVIVPIWASEEEKEKVFAKANEFMKELEKEKISAKIDMREGRPGFKFFEWERKGVPIRVEVGPKDLNNGSAVIVRRDSGSKESVKNENFLEEIKSTLKNIQESLFEKAKEHREKNTYEVNSYDEFKDVIENKGGFALAHWCESGECEEKIKEETKATIRCIAFDQKKEKGKCIYCGKESSGKVIFAKSY